MSNGNQMTMGAALVQRPVLGHFITPRLRKESEPGGAVGRGKPWREPSKARPNDAPLPGREGDPGGA